MRPGTLGSYSIAPVFETAPPPTADINRSHHIVMSDLQTLKDMGFGEELAAMGLKKGGNCTLYVHSTISSRD